MLQLEQIANGIGQTKLKSMDKFESEKVNSDEFIAQLSQPVEQ